MTIAMLIPGATADDPVIGTETADRLGSLGVTRITLLRDPAGIGVVLEGWAFDSAHIPDAVLAVFPDPRADIRVLRQVAEVAVSPMSAERRRA